MCKAIKCSQCFVALCTYRCSSIFSIFMTGETIIYPAVSDCLIFPPQDFYRDISQWISIEKRCLKSVVIRKGKYLQKMLQKISLCDLHDKWLRIFHAKQVVCQIFAQHGSSKLAIDVSNHLWQSNYFREKRQCVSGGTNHDKSCIDFG